MSLYTFPDVIQGTDEWHDLRRGIVTASTVGKLVTTSTLKVARNETSRGLVTSLVAERITGHTEPSPMTDDMWRGVEHEPHARVAYAKHTGADVAEMGFMAREEDGWRLGYSPDGLPGDDGLIEIKCPRQKGHLHTILEDAVPPQYMAQVQAGLFVSGRAWCDYVSFCAGMPLFIKRVHPDEQWHQAIQSAVEAFEQAAADMTSNYTRAVEGMPATERIDFEVVI
ncbi:lambda exonuclease family protein [Isoptericola aurantiacus]|uniref:lambda exonuclease family protein n=1 Tax=Isoptericola aurantiacus TaxID=3377839 RepID=UPI00383A4D7A